MREAVKLPRGEDLNEWLAVNSKLIFFSPSFLNLVSAVDFFNEISLLYGTITEFCTADSCPVMNAGARYRGCRVASPR